MATGGDGYPVFTDKADYATQDIMDQVLADYVTAKSTTRSIPGHPGPDPLHRPEPARTVAQLSNADHDAWAQ